MLTVEQLTPTERQRLAQLVLTRVKRARDTRDNKLASSSSNIWSNQMEYEVKLWNRIFEAVGGMKTAGK